jgi:hypothetical protein
MPKDFWIGAVALGFAALYWHEAGKIRISPLDGPVGAPGLPKALAWALGALALVLVLRGLYQRFAGAAAAAEPETRPLAERLRPHLRAAGILALGVGYLLLVPYFGYALCIMGLIFAVELYSGAEFGLRSVAVAVLGGVFFHLLFVELLGIPLPRGALIGAIL